MCLPYYRVIKGLYTIIGKEPDGDSVRFVADQPGLYAGLHRGDRVKLNPFDGSVQLRFEAVDAPETHYGKLAQPRGAAARDWLLAALGFANVEFANNGSSVVRNAEPASRPGAVLCQGVETNGRPVAYALVGDAAAALDDGAELRVGADLLTSTLNHGLLEAGEAYITVYTSTPHEHRQFLRTVAQAALEGGRGVYAADATSLFRLTDQTDIGPEGQLILPKLFRRASDYLKAVAAGKFHGDLRDWLVAHSAGPHGENDRVLLNDEIEVALSELIEQRNADVAFNAPLNAIAFVEK